MTYERNFSVPIIGWFTVILRCYSGKFDAPPPFENFPIRLWRLWCWFGISDQRWVIRINHEKTNLGENHSYQMSLYVLFPMFKKKRNHNTTSSAAKSCFIHCLGTSPHSRESYPNHPENTTLCCVINQWGLSLHDSGRLSVLNRWGSKK